MMDRKRTRTGILTALLALVVLALGISPALAAASCGMMTAGEACAEMPMSPDAATASDHSGHTAATLTDAQPDPGTSPDGDHSCNHQHCHMTASPVVPEGLTAGAGDLSDGLVAIGGNARLDQQPGYGLEHPPRG